jgi:antitoxin Phd
MLKEVLKMLINPKKQISITEANQNFSKVTKIVDEEKMVIILKQNKPKYLVIDFEEIIALSESNKEEKVWEEVSKNILFKNFEAYKELAK